MPPEDPQRKPYLDPKPGEKLLDKEVSAQGYARLTKAADAIAATKKAIQHQGNQIPSLQSTKLNSAFRLTVMRSKDCWEYTTAESRQLALENDEADVAAKADLAHGGNCGEHASVAFHYLRLHAKGEPIQHAAKSGLDHAFVLIGDLKGDKDADIAVSDPWPNNPMACLWEDHFAYTPDLSKIENNQAMIADGKSYKEAIAAGLKLSAKGEAMVKAAVSQEQTDKWIADNDDHLWNHDDTRKAGHKFHYKQQPAPQPGKADGESIKPELH